jgi:hypothetical protein
MGERLIFGDADNGVTTERVIVEGKSFSISSLKSVTWWNRLEREWKPTLWSFGIGIAGLLYTGMQLSAPNGSLANTLFTKVIWQDALIGLGVAACAFAFMWYGCTFEMRGLSIDTGADKNVWFNDIGEHTGAGIAAAYRKALEIREQERRDGVEGLDRIDD